MQTDVHNVLGISYTYDLSSTLQHNLTLPHLAPTSSTSSTPGPSLMDRQNEKWLWNHHLLLPARSLSSNSSGGGVSLKSDWMLHLVHGFVDQASELSSFPPSLHLFLFLSYRQVRLMCVSFGRCRIECIWEDSLYYFDCSTIEVFRGG